MVEKFIRPRYVQGALKQTPLIKLELTRGEIVQIRPAEEIKATLNHKGCNRGLRYNIGLNELCGTPPSSAGTAIQNHCGIDGADGPIVRDCYVRGLYMLMLHDGIGWLY